MTIGKELIYDTNLSKSEKFYIRIFGVPINGLRIRARRILPLITSDYKNILDAGCGPGIFTFEIAKMLPASKITGIDIDSKLIDTDNKIAKVTGIKNCTFEVQDILSMNYTDNFDLVLSVDNLEHIENDEQALKCFYTSLKNGGTLLIHVPGYYRRWKFFGWAENFYVEGHYRPGYTKDQITEKLIKAGFKIKEAHYTYGWIETITNNISYWITKAEMKNKIFYALVFPFLNFFSYFGKNSKPDKGAGVIVIAHKI